MGMILSDTFLVRSRADYLLNSTQLRPDLSKLVIDAIADVNLQSEHDFGFESVPRHSSFIFL